MKDLSEGPLPGAYSVNGSNVERRGSYNSRNSSAAASASSPASADAENTSHVPSSSEQPPPSSGQVENSNSSRRITDSSQLIAAMVGEDPLANRNDNDSPLYEDLDALWRGRNSGSEQLREGVADEEELVSAESQFLEATAVEPLPETIGIQLRSQRPSFLIEDAQTVLSTNDNGIDVLPMKDEQHPRILYQDLVDKYENMFLERIFLKMFACCSILLALGLGLGLALGNNAKVASGGGAEVAILILEGYSLLHVASKVGEEVGDELGMSNMFTVTSNILLSGSPGYSSTLNSSASNLSETQRDVGMGGVFDLTPVIKGLLNSSNGNTSSATPTLPASLGEAMFSQIFAGANPNDRCGTSVSVSTFGDSFAIGCPGSLTSPGYVKVYSWDRKSPPQQIGSTIHGLSNNDGFGNSIGLGATGGTALDGNKGWRLAIGTKNGGYAQLWEVSLENNAFNDDWELLHDEVLSNYPSRSSNATEGGQIVGNEVTVALAGAGLAFFVGYPSYDNDRGMVRSYSIQGHCSPVDGCLNVSLVERHDPPRYLCLQGNNEGDKFGSAIDTDAFGNFAVVGTNGGGYARAVSFFENLPGGEFQPVGHDIRPPPSSDSSGNDGGGGGEKEKLTGIGERMGREGSDFGTSVATSRVQYGGCRMCVPSLENRRVVVGSSTGFRVYQYINRDLRWYQIAAMKIMDKGNLKVNMSPDAVDIGVGMPEAENGRGLLFVYRILDHLQGEKVNDEDEGG